HHLNRERVENGLDKLSNNYDKCKTYFKKNKNISKSVQLTLENLL
ncbi:unnamed protein product, partial [marine sediment metagenome]